jgi:hypothetical protein
MPAASLWAPDLCSVMKAGDMSIQAVATTVGAAARPVCRRRTLA